MNVVQGMRDAHKEIIGREYNEVKLLLVVKEENPKIKSD